MGRDYFTLRITVAIVLTVFCMALYASAVNYWALFIAWLAGVVCLTCWNRAWRVVLMLIDILKTALSEPDTKEMERTVDTVREAALQIHNWGSRNWAATLGIAAVLVMKFVPAFENIVLALALVLIPGSTHYPAIKKAILALVPAKKPEQTQ